MFGLLPKEEADTITGTLAGVYRGWTGTTVFQLENGQAWVQTDSSDSHFVVPRQKPRVRIEKSMFGGYKLTVEGDPLWVRVRRVK